MDKATKELGEKLLHSLQKTNRLLVMVAQPGQEGEDSKCPDDDTDSESKSTSGTLVSACRKRSPEANQESQSRWKQMVSDWKPTVEIFAFIAAIVYAGITFCQWRDSTTTLRIDQRAWVGTGSVTPKETDKAIAALVQTKNTGKTPAIGIKVKATIDPVTYDQINYFDDIWHLDFEDSGYDTWKGNSVMYPDAVSYIETRPQEGVSIAPMRWVLHGRIAYTDVFKKSHW